MFTMRHVPDYYPEFTWGCRRPAYRLTCPPRRILRAPGDRRLVQDLSNILLLPLLNSLSRGQRHCQKERTWVYNLRMRGYGPADIKISTKDGRVLVQARRVEGGGDNSDVYECNRAVVIPDGVDVGTMKSHFTDDGVLTIEAHLMSDKKEEDEFVNITSDEKPASETLDGEVSSAPTDKVEPVQNDQSLPSQSVDRDVNRLKSDEFTPVNITSDERPSSVRLDREKDKEDRTDNTEGIVEYPESVGSFREMEDFEILSGEQTELSMNTELTIDHDQQTNELDIDDNDRLCPGSEEDVEQSKKPFQLVLDKDQFGDKGLTVLHKGNTLLVKSQKKEEKDGMLMTEYYSSQFTLPDDLDVSQLSCSRNSDGQMMVTAPR